MARAIALTVVFAITVSACASSAGPTTTTVPGPGTTMPGGLLKASLPRITDTDVTAAELHDLVRGNTAFAFDLFRLAAHDGENLILSPYSIAAALTMAYAGARGDTATEMREALRLGLPDVRLHTARNEVDLRVTTPPQADPDDERAPFTIRVANSIWGQAGYSFLEDYLELLATNYDAGMRLVDFVTAAEQARQEINAWVEEETEGRIVDLIPEGVVNDLTRLVLVNAIWFKASWAEQFDPEQTRDEPFHLLDGSVVEVPVMRGDQRTAYTVGDGFQALRLPYAGDAAMVLILPDEGRFEEVVAGFGPDEMEAVRSAWGDYQVDLTLPRFEFRTDLLLRPLLEELGMVVAFRDPSAPDGADFTGITAARELFVQAVVHQAFISVDEEGTEAAAATAVIIGVTSMPIPVRVNVDRPFLFLIEHASTGEILFIGQVVDPRG